jgi:hypothetical protein
MAKKKDVGMAGSSGYDTEFYTTDIKGNPVRNERTMRLQGMDPQKRMADSQKQESRMETMMDNGVPVSTRDRARALATRASMNEKRGTYSESKLQDSIERDNNKRVDLAMTRSEKQDETMNRQARQSYVKKQVGDNSFKPFTKTAPALSKQIMAANAKKKR